MTYDELLSTVTSYTIRDDAPIEVFLRRAESYLRPVTKHYLAEKTALLPVVDGSAELPSDFLEIRILTGTKIYKPVAVQAAVLCEDEVGYYRNGNRITFVGEPDAEVGFLYWAAFPDITADSADSHWLLQRFPNVVISSVLREFHRWQVDQQGVAVEDAAVKEALSILTEDDRRGRQTGPILMGGSGWQ